MKAHWHVATGLSGYGPDAVDGYGRYDDLSHAMDGARDELDRIIDHLVDGANAYGDQEDYKAAWLAHKHAEWLEIFRANVDPKRAEAPLYVDNPALWQRTLQETHARYFPMSIDVENNNKLYVWECVNDECDADDDDDL